MPLMERVPLGTTYRFSIQFRARNNDQSPAGLTNPTTVNFKHESPNGTIVSVTYPATIVRPATGLFHIDVVLSIVGIWKYRWNGDGSVYEGQIQVRASDMA